MAHLAHQVLNEAARAAGTADALAMRMEPHVHRRYGNSAIYAYTNERAVPPGDVLLAAALAAGISLDKKLGIGSEPTDVERRMAELRAELTALRGLVADLQERISGTEGAPDAGQVTTDRPAREARRREWARRSVASPPGPSGPAARPRRIDRAI